MRPDRTALFTIAICWLDDGLARFYDARIEELEDGALRNRRQPPARHSPSLFPVHGPLKAKMVGSIQIRGTMR